jgi:hypothetical protein
LAYVDDKLYVCDTENHAIREIDFELKVCNTVVGTGNRGNDRVGGKTGKEQEISSPWGAALQNKILYFSNSGSHQVNKNKLFFIFCKIWTFDTSSKIASCYSGTGKESHFNNTIKKAEWAQPSGKKKMRMGCNCKEYVFVRENFTLQILRVAQSEQLLWQPKRLVRLWEVIPTPPRTCSFLVTWMVR